MDKMDEIRNVFRSVPGMVEEWVAEFLYDKASACTKGVIVEIGSYLGRSTICIAKGSKSGGRMPVYSIDPHNGGGTTPDPTWRDSNDPGIPDSKYYINTGVTLPEFQESLKNFQVDDIVTSVVDYSELAYKKGWNKPIEMLFIDGEHRYNYVKMDLETWGSHVISGGIILLDDSSHPGVKRVIDEMIMNNPRYESIYWVPIFNMRIR